MDDDSSTPEFPSSRRSERRGRSSRRRSRDRDAGRSRSGSSEGPNEEDFPPFDFELPPRAARGAASGEAGGGSQPPGGDVPAGPPEGLPPQEAAASPVPPAGATPPPSGGSGGGAPQPPGGAGGGGHDELPPFDFEPPAAAGPTGYESPRRGDPRARMTRRERQKQLRRHRLIVLGVFLVVLIVLVVIIAKACSAGGGAGQPKPHKTKSHKTTAAGVKSSASPLAVAVNAVQVAQGESVAVDYRIDGPAGAKGNVKIVVKDKSGTVKELFTLGSAQYANRDLVYRFLAVLDPGTYSLSVQVTLTTGQSASGSSRLTILSSGGASPSPTST